MQLNINYKWKNYTTHGLDDEKKIKLLDEKDLALFIPINQSHLLEIVDKFKDYDSRKSRGIRCCSSY